MDCIKGCWDLEDQKGVYSCPQCRQTFTPRPVLSKNNIFAELVEQIKKTRIQAAAPVPCTAGPGDVECDVCTGRKLKAVKSCLECLVSYCETHYKVHNDIHPGRKHKVVDATGQLQERICTQHEKPLEIFCRTDLSCVCLLCLVDEHKGHDTVSASAGRREKQVRTGVLLVIDWTCVVGRVSNWKERQIDSSSLGYYSVRQRENNNDIKTHLSNEVVKPDG